MLTPLTTPHDLAYILGTTYSKLSQALYDGSLSSQYTTFTIHKKTGGLRLICSPGEKISYLQRRLKVYLDQLYDPHIAASAFIQGRGIVYNASQHTKKSVIFNIDLKNFYDEIHFGRVKGLLVKKPYSLDADVARLIAHLCCFKSRIPQGAATSPTISNMICRSLDHALTKLAKKNRAHYSRYADDITFSFRIEGDNDIYERNEGGAAMPSAKLNHLIESNGFKINKKKTRLQCKSERQVVTGLKVNEKVNVDRRYIRKTRAMIHSMEVNLDEARHRFSKMNLESDTTIDAHLCGRINFIGMVKGRSSSVYQTLAHKFNVLAIDYRVPTRIAPKEPDYERGMEYNSYKYISELKDTVWILDFLDVDGINDDGEYIEGTAFRLKDGRIMTTTHTFTKAGSPSYCNLKRVNDITNSYRANVVRSDLDSDITILELVNAPENLKGLSVASNLNIITGYKVALAGFPQRLLGGSSVTVKPCVVTNNAVIGTFDHVEIDAEIQAGNSGGPVLNAYNHVVGMARMGVAVSIDTETNQANLEGNNVYISAKHFK